MPKEVALSVTGVDPSGAERLREWAASELEGQSEAAGDGNVHAEAVFLGRAGETDYLYYYCEAEDADRAIAAFKRSIPEDVRTPETRDEPTGGGSADNNARPLDPIFHVFVDEIGTLPEKDVILSIQPIVEGKVPVLEDWFASEAENKAKVQEALVDEGILVESVFVQVSRGDEYLVYYIVAANFEDAMEEFLASEHENIQQYHEVVEETLVGGLEEYHANRSEILHHAVPDPESR